MKQTKQPLIARAPKIKASLSTPIRLSPEEFAEANAYAAAQDRSRAAFLRLMYLKGLAALKADLG